jgi:hypothetical protein
MRNDSKGRSGRKRVDQARWRYAAGGAWQGRFVGRLGCAGVGAASGPQGCEVRLNI